MTDTLKNEVITKLRSQYLTLAEREADWSRRYGKNHLAVINTRNQMNEIKNSIFDELQRIAESYKSDYEIAKQRQTGIEHELDQAVVQSQVVDRAQVQLMELESNAQSYRTLYDDFLLRYTESVQQQSFPMTQARVITPAARPLTKSHPKTLLVLLISAAGGMIVGLMIGHLRDLTDRVFRTRDQVERLLALDCLATVPKIKVDRPKGNSSHAESKVGKPPEVGSTPAPDVKAGEPNVNLSSAADVKVDKTNGDMLTALDVKVGESTGDASAAPCIETGEPNDGLSAVPGIETGEPNDGLSAVLGIEADEPNTASPPAPDLKVSMPKVAPWPDPDIIVGGPKDDASPDPDINVGGPKDDASPDPDINVGGPKDDASPDPDINVGGPKDDASPDPDINVGGRKDDAPPDPDINGGEANVDPVPDPDITVSMSEGDPSPVAEMVDLSPVPRTIGRVDPLLWQVVDFPLSPYAEAIRSIKMAADLSRARVSKKVRKPKKVVGITSSSPSEGKSTISASLAQLISHSGKRVILVDCDLRAPRLTRVLAPGAKAGLLEVLSGDASLGDVIWTDQSKQLSFLPAVATARIPHTAEIIGAEEMRALFDRLRVAYDYVIVDLTPLVPIVDVRATEGLVDYYIFVIEWGRTKIDLVERSLKEAPGIYNKILGAVLNKVGGSELKRYEGYGGYDHDKYYHR